MKVRPSVKKICEKCKVVRRKGVVRIICENPATSSGKAEQSDHGPHRRRRPPPS